MFDEVVKLLKSNSRNVETILVANNGGIIGGGYHETYSYSRFLGTKWKHCYFPESKAYQREVY